MRTTVEILMQVEFNLFYPSSLFCVEWLPGVSYTKVTSPTDRNNFFVT
jgi:hypothetical protein